MLYTVLRLEIRFFSVILSDWGGAACVKPILLRGGFPQRHNTAQLKLDLFSNGWKDYFTYLLAKYVVTRTRAHPDRKASTVCCCLCLSLCDASVHGDHTYVDSCLAIATRHMVEQPQHFTSCHEISRQRTREVGKLCARYRGLAATPNAGTQAIPNCRLHQANESGTSKIVYTHAISPPMYVAGDIHTTFVSTPRRYPLPKVAADSNVNIIDGKTLLQLTCGGASAHARSKDSVQGNPPQPLMGYHRTISQLF